MKIYTRIGDKGTTLLADGRSVPKTSLRIEAYGTVDELNANLGLLSDFVMTSVPVKRNDELLTLLKQAMLRIQNELFALGAYLAKPSKAFARDIFSQPSRAKDVVKQLEDEMDHFSDQLEPLKNFVLPGGHHTNSQAHVVRCVCRRAERAVLRLAEAEDVNEEARIYLNRLSDWFFVVSRVVTQLFGGEEVLWRADQ